VVNTAAGEKTVTIIAAITPNLPFISSPGNVAVDENVAAAVQAEVNAASGSDVIIFVSHLQGVAEDIELIGNVTGIDLAIAGGGDDLLANEGDLLLPGDSSSAGNTYPIYAADSSGKMIPIVTTTGEYRYLGNLVVDFDADNELIGIGGRPIPVADIATGWPDAVRPDPEVMEQVTDPVAAYLEALSENVIADNDVALDGRRNSVRGFETALGNLVSDSMLWAAQSNAAAFGIEEADIALVGGGGLRNNTILNEAGAADAPFTELDTFDIAPFANFVSVVHDITPSQLKDQLETTLSRTVARDGAIVPSGGGTGRFAQVAGFSVVYDPSRQAQILDGQGNEIIPGDRVISAILDDGTVLIENGEPVDGAPSVDIAVTSFHAGGGDQWFWFLDEIPYTTVGLTYQQALANFVQEPTAEGGLGGEITVADYGTVGERIVITGDALVFEWDPFEINGWRISSWLGAVWTGSGEGSSGWYFLPGFGWSFLSETVTSPNAVWFVNEKHGWFFTSKPFYPYVWSGTTSAWYFVDFRTPNPDGILIYRLSDGAIVDSLKE
jgi:5'-nucleotidase